MLEITATCETPGCSHQNIPSVFISDVTATVCAACNVMIENITTKEVINGSTETAE